MKNTLYYADNLKVMRKLDTACVDLIYLDPPFNSNANYNVIFDDGKDKAQNEAFVDIWTWNTKKQTDYKALLDNAHGAQTDKTLAALKGLYTILDKCGLMAYLVYMQPRLLEMKRLLQDTGSLYLHCDPSASHYLKVLLDSIFGAQHFRNEIVWHYQTGGASKQMFARKHDILFFYSKGNHYNFYSQDVKILRTPEVLRRLATGNESATRAVTETKLPMDVWADIQALNPMAKERLGYPTQKPLALLDRVIKASSQAGNVVLDPFCGCGTTMDAAHKLGRQWIGIDISYLAIDTVRSRLTDRYGKKMHSGKKLFDIGISGVPKDITGAEKLLRTTLECSLDKKVDTLDEAIAMAERRGSKQEKHKKNAGRFEFQRWACSLVDATPNDREVGDGGIDGKLKWATAENDIFGVVSVKTAKYVSPDDVRALKGVISNGSGYVMGLLISLYKTDTEEISAICADFAQPHWEHYTGGQYPKLQVWSIEEHFASKSRPNMPTPFKPYKKADKDAMQVQQVAY